MALVHILEPTLIMSVAGHTQGVSFPELEAKIAKGIEQLGGNVLPKLNWSAPRVRSALFACF